MMRSLAALLLLLTLAACSGAASTAPPSAGPTPAPTTIATVEDAAARVIEVYPAFEGIGPKDPNIIGGCCWWEGTETGDGFTVTFEVGWGDCLSGCIDRHRWTYAVSSDGAVTLIEESGSPVPSGLPGAGGGTGGGTRRVRRRRGGGIPRAAPASRAAPWPARRARSCRTTTRRAMTARWPASRSSS